MIPPQAPTPPDGPVDEQEEAYFRDLHRLPAARSWWTSVTGLLVAANLAVFMVMGLLGAGWWTERNLHLYQKYGANSAILTVNGQWWRLLTSQFLHFGLVHLAFNLWALSQMGALVERILGRPLYLFTYLGSGIVGGLATVLWHGPQNPWLSAGASGAIFGLFGALLGYMLRERSALPWGMFRPLLRSTLAFTAYNLAFGFLVAKIDNAAHVGGLLGGILLGWVVALPVDLDVRRREVWRRLAWGLVVLALVFAAGVAAAWRARGA